MAERIVAPNAVAFAGGRVIASPFQFYLDGNDNLRLEGWNTCTGAVLQVQGRAIDELGVVKPFNMELTLTADRVRNRRDFAPVRGYILNLVAVATGAEPCIGQTFARVSLIRGFTGATIVLGVLLQGYVTSQHGLGWPGSPIQTSIESGGYVRPILGAVPAAGAQILEVVPTAARWQLLRCRAALQTAAGGANRFIRLELYGTTIISFTAAQATSQGPSQFARYSWGGNLPIAVDATNFYFQQPYPAETELIAGDSVATGVTNMAAGDQWTALHFQVREWLEIE